MKAVVAVMRPGLRLLYSVARDRRMFTLEPPRARRQVVVGPSVRRSVGPVIA